jgi:hypothetical protein
VRGIKDLLSNFLLCFSIDDIPVEYTKEQVWGASRRVEGLRSCHALWQSFSHPSPHGFDLVYPCKWNSSTCRVLFEFIRLAHERRRSVHVNITEHPTAHW